MHMTPQRWWYTTAYLRAVFGEEDALLRSLMSDAVAEGLPDIAVSPEVGRLLAILTGLTEGRLALEIGTLAGYSGVWIARSLRPDGRLLSIEANPRHAAFARRTFASAGLAERVEVLEGKALDILPGLQARLAPGTVDLVFIDAVKAEYPAYFDACRALLKVGGVLVADNALGSSWWIDDPPGSSVERDEVDRFNRTIARDPDFVTTAVPLRQGLLIARRTR